LVAVVIKIPDAHSLSPACSREAGFRGHVRKGTVAVIVIEMVGGCLAGRHPIKPRTVHQDDVFPSVVVVVDEACAATGSLKEVPVAMLIPVNGFAGQPSFSRYVNEADPEIAGRAIPPDSPSGNQSDAQQQD